jgi:hypothetical protein
MKITIRHDQNSIDPSATYTDEQFAQVKESLEREYTKAILAEYPDAEIEFEEANDTNDLIVRTNGLDDPSENKDNIQRITRIVRMIRQEAPDVIGIQEALHGQAADLWASLPDYEFLGNGRHDGSRAGEYSAILYRREDGDYGMIPAVE